MKKTVYHNETLPDLRKWFNWGINISDFKETFFVTGTVDIQKDNHSANFPNDPVRQIKFILEQAEKTFSQAGYTKDDIIFTNWTVTKDVTEEQTWALFDVWEQYIKDVEVKPATGTFKRIHGLISPEVMVEIEFILAR